MTVVLCDSAIEILALWRGGVPEGIIVLKENQELLSFPPVVLQMEMRKDYLSRVVHLGGHLVRLAALP